MDAGVRWICDHGGLVGEQLVPRSKKALSALLREGFCKGASGSLVQFSLVLEDFRGRLCPQLEDQRIMVCRMHGHFI